MYAFAPSVRRAASNVAKKEIQDDIAGVQQRVSEFRRKCEALAQEMDALYESILNLGVDNAVMNDTPEYAAVMDLTSQMNAAADVFETARW